MRQESLQWATTQIEGGIPGEFGAGEKMPGSGNSEGAGNLGRNAKW